MELKIKTQPTPNPNALKYILNRDVKREGKVSYTELDECAHVPLAHELLATPGVSQVHLFDNIVTVTKDADVDWSAIDTVVRRVLSQQIDSHNIDFVAQGEKKPVDRSELSPALQTIEAILDRTVRPGLQADGGDLEVLELDGNVLTIRYEGACGGCPSAMYGTLEAIRSILQNEFQPDLEVVAV